MNRRHRTSALVLAVIVSAWVDQAQAQQPAKDMAAKDAEKRQYEARRGLAGFEWIEPLYPDCPKARFKLKNDECGGVKKHPRDPEDVLEDYWRRSVWAYTLRFAERVKPADKSAVRADLPKHVQAIELRVVWDQEHYRYECELNMIVDRALLDFVMLPGGVVGRRFTGAGMLPPGASYPPPVPRTILYRFHDGYDEYVFYDVFDLPKERGQIGRGRGVLQQYHKAYADDGNTGYLGLKIGCGSENNKFKRFRLWLPASRAQEPPAETARFEMSGRIREYLVLDLPVEPFHRAAPYWRRAFGINVCNGDRKDYMPPDALVKHFRACEALRRDPIDSLKTPLEMFNEQYQSDQKRKPR